MAAALVTELRAAIHEEANRAIAAVCEAMFPPSRETA